MKQFLAALLILLGLTATAQAATLTPVKEWSGDMAASGQADRLVLRTDSDWQSTFYQSISATSIPVRPPGTIGLAIFLGPRGTAGYSINIINLDLINGKIYVDFEEVKAVRGSPYGTSPWRVLAVQVKDPNIEVVYTQNLWSEAGAIFMKIQRFIQTLFYRIA